MVTWEKEEWKGKSFFLCVYYHPVFYTLILVIAPNLQKQNNIQIEMNKTSYNLQSKDTYTTLITTRWDL
jgi:hypothetical protein